MNFLGAENSCNSLDTAKIVIIPVPFEASTSYRSGTADGPRAILEASPYLELYDEELDMDPSKAGIFAIDPLESSSNPQEMMNRIEQTVLEHLQLNKFCVMLGGEHTISFAAVKALQKIRAPFSVLQLDAHSDLRDEYESSKWSHACVMRRIWEVNRSIVQVGIRAQSVEEREFKLEQDIKTYYAKDLPDGILPDTIIDDLAQDVYITLDMDFFDPSLIPSTGTPEPGGFFWNQTLPLLRKVFQRRQVIGMDIVELSPIRHLHHPDFIAAKLVYKLLGYYLEGDTH